MKEIGKPYYQININSLCASEVFIDDVIVWQFIGESTKGDNRRTGLIPINQVLLQSGKYKVVGKMYPRYGSQYLTEENAYLSIDFYVANANNLKNTRINFHPTLESPWGGLSENINYPYYEIATEIEVTLPFVLDGWQNSVNLNDIDEKMLFNQVLDYYNQIRMVLKEHDAGKYLAMSKEKMALQEQAFYFTEERKQSFLEGAANLFSQNLEVLPLEPENLKLEIMGYGKLVRLLRLDGSEALQFKSPNPQEQSNIELDVKLHMRTKEKGFSII